MIGQTVSHYRVLEKIGEGGMGVVYKAEDTQLGRIVALKFLSAHLSHSPQARQRLVREARAASALDHPGICTVYEAGETGDGRAFIAMAYYEGAGLDETIQAGMGREDPLVIALNIARAVESAHQRGITHRDLKPQNIMLIGGGEIKVLDFGLARLAGQAHLTEAGVRAGTAAYMSPEQARGEMTDHRTDIWSLGVILYEMLSGEKPFRGEYDEALLFAILNEPPPPMERPVAPAVTRILLRALEKDPRNRYQSAAEMIADLQKALPRGPEGPRRRITRRTSVRLVIACMALLAAGAVTLWLTRTSTRQEEPPRVLVTPFSNRTGDTVQKNLGIITAEVITDGLTQIGGVRVVQSDIMYRLHGEMSRAGVAAVRATAPAQDFSAAAREVKARFVISGSYYRRGEGLRIHTAVHDVLQETVVFSLEASTDDASRPEPGLADLRERLVGAFVATIGHHGPGRPATLTRPMRFDAFRRITEAEELFFSGEFSRAVPVYLQAYALDTTTVLPLLEAAVACYNLSDYARSDSLTRIVARRADALNAHDGLLLRILQSWLEGDWTRAFLLAREQGKLCPGTISQFEWGHSGLRSNRPRETVTALETLDPEGVSMKGWFYYWRDLTNARHILREHVIELEESRRGRRQYPDRIEMFECEIRALAALRDTAGVLNALEEAATLRVVGPEAHAQLARTAAGELWTHGAPATARRAAERGLALLRRHRAPGGPSLRHIITECDLLWELERWEEARALVRDFAGNTVADVRLTGRLGTLAAALGDSAAVRLAITRLLDSRSLYGFGSRELWLASIHANAGRQDDAVSALQASFAAGLPGSVGLHHSIALRPLRDHAGFQALLAPRND